MQNDTDASLSIVDVRKPEEYAERHIAGAINVPLDLLDEKLDQLSKDRPIVTYCMMQHRGESRGERAADQLRANGYDVRVLNGGLPAWEKSGYPVAQGTE